MNFIQQMPVRGSPKTGSYFIYLPGRRNQGPWECTATSVGYEPVCPGSCYPPKRHPVDHYFTWENGRVLQAYQLLYITEGRGFYESEFCSRTRTIEAGTVIILFPGIWHRYSPDSETGWVEHWIECRGNAFDRARETGLLRPERSVLRVGLSPDLLQGFERCHTLARRRSASIQAMLSTMGLHLLSILYSMPRLPAHVVRPIDQKVNRAQLLIASRYHEMQTIKDLAQEMSVGYSYFRQAFKAATGLCPKQYQLQIRLQKAQEFLSNTTKSIAEIAEILGFASPFHLSRQFKKHVGIAPQIFRKRLRRSISK
jgi:AraC-like DNA-binding protein